VSRRSKSLKLRIPSNIIYRTLNDTRLKTLSWIFYTRRKKSYNWYNK